MSFSDYKFRCSGLGSLMTNDRSGKGMGDTARSYLMDCYLAEKYGYHKNIQSKYIEKGLMVEDIAIATYSFYKEEVFEKNEIRYSNEFLTGHPDIISDRIIDIKSSWDVHTFMASKKKINKNYYWQLQGYMWLTDRQSSELVYVLIDTPEQLIQDEMRRQAWKMGIQDDTSEEYVLFCEEYRESINWDKMPLAERIYEVEIKRDEKAIEDIKSRVLEAREYLETL